MTHILEWRGRTLVEASIVMGGDYRFEEDGRTLFYHRLKAGDYLTVFDYAKGLLLRRVDHHLAADIPANHAVDLSTLPGSVTPFV